MEMASNALNKDSSPETLAKLKEKTEMVDELTNKIRQLEERSVGADEEVKAKM